MGFSANCDLKMPNTAIYKTNTNIFATSDSYCQIASHIISTIANLTKAYRYYFSHCFCFISDFAEPLQLGGAQKKTAEITINEEGVVMIQSMGFTRDQAIKALKATVR